MIVINKYDHNTKWSCRKKQCQWFSVVNFVSLVCMHRLSSSSTISIPPFLLIASQNHREPLKTIEQQSQPEHEELEWYLSEPIAQENEDPLDFWTTNQSKHPCLAPVAFDMLVIPTSSATVERVFSTAGIVTSGRRNHLQDKNLEGEVLIKKNRNYVLTTGMDHLTNVYCTKYHFYHLYCLYTQLYKHGLLSLLQQE